MSFQGMAQRLEQVLGRANDRLNGEDLSISGHREMLAESVEEFSAALEQLQVISEEMQHQNDELIATRAAVEAERRRYRELFELAPGGYLVTDSIGNIREANQAAKSLLGVPRHTLEDKPLIVFVDQPDRLLFRLRLSAMSSARGPVEWVTRLRSRGGRLVTTALKCVPVRGRHGELSALRWLLRDITEQQRAQALVTAQKSVLEKIARGLPLSDALDALCRFVEDQLPGRHCSVLLNERGTLRFGAAPSLPDEFNRAVDGLKIGPCNGACGTAVYRREAVVVDDVATDPLCADIRDQLLACGLRSCWSTPVFSNAGDVLACFAIYGLEGQVADPRFPQLIEVATDLAGIAIQRMLSEKALSDSEERYRVFVEQSSEAIWRFELDEPISTEASDTEQIEHYYKHAYLAECNDAMARMYARSSAEEMVGKRLGDLLDPSEPRNIEYLKEFIRSGYRMSDSESHEPDADGKKRYFLNNLVGIVEDAKLIRAWGTQRDVTGQHNAQEEINQRNRQLATLNATAAAVSSSLELSSVLGALKELLVEQMEIPSGGIYLYDEADDAFHLQVDWGIPDEMLSRLRTYPATRFHGDQNLLSLEFGDTPAFSTPGNRSAEGAEWQSYLRVPLVAQGRIQGIAALLEATPRRLSLDQITFFEALGQQVGVAIQNARLFGQVSAARERMRMLSRRLVEVQEDERRHIARELHDQVGQSLTGLTLQLELCRRMPQLALPGGIDNAQSLANELIAQVRDLALILRPTILDDLGLLPALLWHFERYTESTGIQVAFEHAGLEQRFTADVETAAYRVAQEALTNVARHAGVRDATVKVWANNEVLCVQVADQGAGFDAKAAPRRHTSIGLAGMRERALLLGGQLIVESAAGNGAQLTAQFPLSGTKHASAKR
jgi:PAS domain S-box-containing protein